MSTSSANSDAGKAADRPGLSVTQLLAAKGTRPIRSLEELISSENETVREFSIPRSPMRKAPAALRCYRRTAEAIS